MIMNRNQKLVAKMMIQLVFVLLKEPTHQHQMMQNQHRTLVFLSCNVVLKPVLKKRIQLIHLKKNILKQQLCLQNYHPAMLGLMKNLKLLTTTNQTSVKMVIELVVKSQPFFVQFLHILPILVKITHPLKYVPYARHYNPLLIRNRSRI